MPTMNDMYADGSEHSACESCGMCRECGDCECTRYQFILEHMVKNNSGLSLLYVMSAISVVLLVFISVFLVVMTYP